MPNTKSAKKALKQSKVRRVRNLERMRQVKATIKEYKKAITEKSAEVAQKGIKDVYKAADKAAKKNVISKNKASRLKSKMAKRLQAIN